MPFTDNASFSPRNCHRFRADIKAKRGNGKFQWNAAGWFGSQLGSTAWIFILAVEMVPKSALVASWLAACAAAPNLFGCLLWMKRDRLAPYPAIQALLSGIGVFTLLALIVADHFRVFPVIDPRLMASSHPGYWVMCFFPLMLAWFASMERTAVTRNNSLITK